MKFKVCFRRYKELLGVFLRNISLELLLSLAIFICLALFLSLMMWMAEFSRNPDFSLIDAIVWVLAKSIQDPAEVASALVTPFGCLVGSFVGLIGILLFAVPTSIFVSAMIRLFEQIKEINETENNAKSLRMIFRRIAQPASTIGTGIRMKSIKHIPRFRSIGTISVKLGLSSSEIIKAINYTPDIRLVNLASTCREDEFVPDKLVATRFPLNREYGCCIDRESDVTIVAPCALTELGTGNFAFSIAAMGGFNYVSRELLPQNEETIGFYTIKEDILKRVQEDEDKVDLKVHLLHFIDDLKYLRKRSDERNITHWYIFIMGALRSVDSQIHLWRFANNKNLPKTLNNENYGSTIMTSGESALQSIYKSISQELKDKNVLQRGSEKSISVALDDVNVLKAVGDNNIMRRLGGGEECNALTMRIGYEILIYSNSHLSIAMGIAESIRKGVGTPSQTDDHCYMNFGDDFCDDSESKKFVLYDSEISKMRSQIESDLEKAKKKYKNRRLNKK